MLTLHVVFKLTWFIVHFVSTEARHLVTEYYYSADNKFCNRCSPGTYWIADCKDNLSDAKCLPCSSGSFQSTLNIAHRCEQCSVCENIVKNYQLARTLMDCTAVTNTKCACQDGYYLKKVYGSANEWMCKTISVCDPGYEVIHPASHFTDTVCQECRRGYFKESSSTVACRLCSVDCRNGTHLISPCNTTHDAVCSKIEESANDGVFINTDNDAEIVILTTCSIIGGICVVLTVLWFVRIFRKRRIKKETNPERTSSTYVDGPIDDDITLNENDWIQAYRSTEEGEYNWTGLFHECTSKPEIIYHWEHFIRILCIKSRQSSKADQIIAEITSGYEQKRVKDRIYNALCLWKGKCYSVGDEYMVTVFTDSFYKHQEEYNQTRS
ncbi:tumor necrosis factor receptor superfamily member 5-like isoform X1 [Mytilus californianus]|uniref:tumor necrosis factor receptor superfamily member 5-like isoform X1 n=1 Tax=Mytilus californianus TaxID=6549 RepID=UPI00224600F5|nr:tumor necrosis factor receptor superfamily member 5-like isoform X1 [Mytilus californianus]